MLAVCPNCKSKDIYLSSFGIWCLKCIHCYPYPEGAPILPSEFDTQRLYSALAACEAIVNAVENLEDDPQVEFLREAERLARIALEQPK